MLDMIGTLEKNGYAYEAANRDVCYSVRKFEGYGKLSCKSLEDLRAGERVDVMAGKHDPLDFGLWKHARDDEPSRLLPGCVGCSRRGPGLIIAPDVVSTRRLALRLVRDVLARVRWSCGRCSGRGHSSGHGCCSGRGCRGVLRVTGVA